MSRHDDERISDMLDAKLRDVLAHQYFRIDPEIVWETAISDIPRLAQDLRRAR